MGKRRFALERGGPKDLRLRWRWRMKDFQVSLGDASWKLDRPSLETGATIVLPDGSSLFVRSVKRRWWSVGGRDELVIERDGIPIPGSDGDPRIIGRGAARLIILFALLRLGIVALLLLFQRPGTPAVFASSLIAGGAFFGMRSQAGDVYSQPDVLYVVFSKADLSDNRGIEFALAGLRDGALITRKTSGNVVAFVSDLDEHTEEGLARTLEAQPLSFDTLPPYVCLIERHTGAVVSIHCSRPQEGERYIKLTPGPDGFGLSLLPDLVALLQQLPDATETLPVDVPHISIEGP